MLTGLIARLRPYDERDVTLLGTLRNDVELQPTLLSLPRGSPPERIRDWLTRMSADPETLFYVIADRSTDHAVGYVSLARIDYVHGTGALAICIDRAAHRRGYGRESLRLLEEHANGTFRVRKITLEVRASNEAAIALYAQAGYERVGVLRAQFYHRGAYHDVVIMEKLLGEPEARDEGEGSPGEASGGGVKGVST